ncbi:hypothetical protein C8J56DRAFT_1060733 [Mycena floridula]|nr:hypothetical protein C8J56DRAFT_1060733 [Mycena floridula]
MVVPTRNLARQCRFVDIRLAQISLYHASWAGCSVVAHPLAVLWLPAIPWTLSCLNLVSETWTWWRAHATKAVFRLWSTNFLARILLVVKPLTTLLEQEVNKIRVLTAMPFSDQLYASDSPSDSAVLVCGGRLRRRVRLGACSRNEDLGTSATFPSSGDSAGHQRSMDPRHPAMRLRSAKAMIRKMSSAVGPRRR